jgi:hypothetical protein
MALRLFERTLAAVKPELRPLYVPDEEHGYRLDVSDLESYVHGLKSALAKCRDEKKELRAKFGVTPDGAEALSAFGEIPKARGDGLVPDVRAGLLPRRTPRPCTGAA